MKLDTSGHHDWPDNTSYHSAWRWPMRRAHAGLTGLCNLQLQHHGTPWCSRLSAAVTREGLQGRRVNFQDESPKPPGTRTKRPTLWPPSTLCSLIGGKSKTKIPTLWLTGFLQVACLQNAAQGGRASISFIRSFYSEPAPRESALKSQRGLRSVAATAARLQDYGSLLRNELWR